MAEISPTILHQTLLFAMAAGKSTPYIPVSLEMASGKVSFLPVEAFQRRMLDMISPLALECMSSELNSSLFEGNKQWLEVAIYLRQCKMLSPSYILKLPKKVGVTTVHPFQFITLLLFSGQSGG